MYTTITYTTLSCTILHCTLVVRHHGKVVSTEQPAGQWGFKATKQMVKLYLRMGNSEKVMEKYRNVLEYIQGIFCFIIFSMLIFFI